jgi:hypothetical protein
VSGRPGTTRYLQPLDPITYRPVAEPPGARESPYFPWGYPPLPDPTPVATEHLLDQALASRAGRGKTLFAVWVFSRAGHIRLSRSHSSVCVSVKLCDA